MGPQLTVTIRDAQRVIHGRGDFDFADAVVASLSAEPETIAELEAAMVRFRPGQEPAALADWPAGACDEPSEAGTCLVDLAARLVVLQSDCYSAGSRGYVRCVRKNGREGGLSYHVSPDWGFIHRTRQEWEDEQRDYEEYSRKCEEERKQRQAEGQEDVLPWDDETPPSVWQRTFSGPKTGNEPPSIVLFGIGCCVAELGVDLKSSAETAPLVETINRHFDNLRSAFGDPSHGLLDPVVDRFCEDLDAVAEARPDLAAKCEDLQRQLREFAAGLGGQWDDVPF